MRKAPTFSRRELLAATGLLATLGWRDLLSAAESEDVPFHHGVASGDPMPDRVILWTRVTPLRTDEETSVRWIVALDPRLAQVVARGEVRATALRDHTVKIDAGGLQPGTTYYYAFEARGARSPVGRTKTLPAGKVRHGRLAFASCANLPAGVFNAYACIAARDDLDAVLHLGDYLYEFANGIYGDGSALGRIPIPNHEAVSLADYRQRHAQYKRDPDLQAAHRQHPFLCIWDDHEIANDAWRDGAANHDPVDGEGEWWLRKRSAIRAYLEWMPIRERPAPDAERIFRRLPFGDLADFMLLDTRLVGRDAQASCHRLASGDCDARDPLLRDPSRSLLGAEQEAWLDTEMQGSQRRGTRWRILAQQVMLAPLSTDGGRSLLNLDQWDGYPAARQRLYDGLRQANIDNLVVLTGDAHASFAADLIDDHAPRGAEPSVGVEFVTPAISSPGIEDDREAAQLTQRLQRGSPHLRHIDLQRRGYGVLDLTRDRALAEIWHLETVASRSDSQWLAARFACEAGSGRLHGA